MEQRGSLTKGRVLPTLLRFSLPFLLANVLQALYSAADLMIVGHYAASQGVSAVATGSQVMQTVTSLFIGLCTGSTVLTGQWYGAGDKPRLRRAVSTTLRLYGALGASVSSLLYVLSGPMCVWMRAPAEASPDTQAYLSICAIGLVFVVGYNALASLLRGLGDSKTPFVFVAVACGANVAGDLFLVGHCALGARGAALATAGAQALSCIAMALYMLKKGFFRRYAKARWHSGQARSMLSVGLPVAAQEALVNAMGLTASAAVGVVEKLIVFTMLPTTAFASAIAAMAAQQRGAGLPERAWACLRGGIGLSLVFGLCCYALCQLCPEALIGLFTTDADVVRVAAVYLRSYSVDCVVVCFVFCCNSFCSAMGHATFPLVHSFLTTCLIRLPLSSLFSRPPYRSMALVGLAAPLASLCSLALCFAFLNHLHRRAQRVPWPRFASGRL